LHYLIDIKFIEFIQIKFLIGLITDIYLFDLYLKLMTTSLPPQGAFQQSPYIQTHSSNNTPSFPSSTNQTAYFSPRSDNKQFLNQPNQHNPPRNLSPNFGVQPQKVPQSNLRMSNNPQIPFQK